jgi:stage II sporulation protein M
MAKKETGLQAYKECFSYIKESRNYIYLAGLVFFLLFAMGFFIKTPDFLAQQIKLILKNIVYSFQGLGLFETIAYIFVNNFFVVLMGFLLGILFGVFPFISLILNGYIVGFVFKIASQESGFFILWKILPYGLFELLAVFIGMGLSMKLGMSFFSRKKGEFFRRFILSAKTFLLIIIPLLLLAAFIEGILIYFLG